MLAFAIGVMAGARPVRAAETRYELDEAHSRVTIQVGKAGLFGFAGHEHEVVTGALRGSITADPTQLASAHVALAFEAAALRVTGKGEPAGDVPKVQAAMVGPKCLDAARFPLIEFASTGVSVDRTTAGAADLTVRGRLMLHGVTREIRVPLHLDFGTTGAGTFTATGKTTLKQTDYGIEPITVAGVVKVKDEIALTWMMRGRPPTGK
jgi:polyisoprenoid-binding protein YceI